MRKLRGGEPPTSARDKGSGRCTVLILMVRRKLGGRTHLYPVKDPTADERAVVAGRIYRSILDEWTQRAMSTPQPDQPAPDIEARSSLELAERLGPWSLRWQEAQDNAAKSLAARYQAMSDHLGRMSALEDGRFRPETGQATETGRTEAIARIGRGRTVLPSDR